MTLPNPPEYTISPDGTYILNNAEGKPIRYEKYQYKPLSKPGAIRLLRPNFNHLAPSHKNQGRMNHWIIEEFNLRQPHLRYTSISYAWGESAATVPLTLGSEAEGRVCFVTPTAWQIMHNLGAHYHRLWFDQLCINQEDIREKEMQIHLMQDPYFRLQCITTIVWLGAANYEARTAFAFIRILASLLHPDRDIPINADDASHMPRDLIRKSIQAIYPDYLPPSDDDHGWNCVAMLFGRPWFSRMETFQDAALGQDGKMTFVCAYRDQIFTLALRWVIQALILLGNYQIPGYNDVMIEEGKASFRSVILAQQRNKAQATVSLGWLLNLTANRDCMMPKDKIYALLGCQSNHSSRIDIKPDLSKPDREVYAHVTKKIIASELSILISLTASGRKGGRVACLPSWVPDYTARIIAPCMEALNPNRPLFSASRGQKFCEIFDSSVPWDQLVVRGHEIDGVTEVLCIDMPNDANEDSTYIHLRQLLPRLMQWSNPSSDEECTVQMMYRIARTMISDTHGADLKKHRRFSFVTKKVSNIGKESEFISPEYAVAAAELQNENEDEDRTMLQLIFAPTSPPVVDVVLSEETQRRWTHDFIRQTTICKGRRFAMLQKYGLGLVPLHTEPDDIVTILHGSSLPVILRAKGDGKFQLVGPCFVDGIMRGEAVSGIIDPARPYRLV